MKTHFVTLKGQFSQTPQGDQINETIHDSVGGIDEAWRDSINIEVYKLLKMVSSSMLSFSVKNCYFIKII